MVLEFEACLQPMTLRKQKASQSPPALSDGISSATQDYEDHSRRPDRRHRRGAMLLESGRSVEEGRQPEWSDLEWQLRNWLYFTWLSGDHIVEQHVHNIDVVNWAMKAHPVRALGLGGRQARTDPGIRTHLRSLRHRLRVRKRTHMMSMSGNNQGADGNVSEALTGTKGSCLTQACQRYQIKGEKPWQFPREEDKTDPYQQEHTDLIESIRAGKPLNELKNVAESTLTAIMGRMSAYTGKVVTWDQALNSTESLVPAKLEWGPMPVPPIAIPGQMPAIEVTEKPAGTASRQK